MSEPARPVRHALVTGEAVELDIRTASFASRMLAIALDLVVQVAVLVALLLAVGALGAGLDQAASTAVTLLVVIVVLVVAPAAVESLSRGRSLGKLAAGLRVVRDDGGPVRFRHSLVRALLGFVEFYLTGGSAALICSLVNGRGKRFGDLLAGTYVIRERSARTRLPPAVMPPELAGWAAAADIGRLPDGLALATRQFLARADRLHPASRQRLGLELAHQVARQVAPFPPAGTHPERFLSAVLAERRRRDLLRLAREQQRLERLTALRSPSLR